MADVSKTFTVDRPEEVNRTFATAYNSGSLDNLLSLYESEAHLVDQENTVSVGLNAVSDLLQKNLLKLGGEMISKSQYVITANDIALICANWVITTTNLNGEKVEVRGKSVVIVRRQSDGSWKYLIDHPFGAG